MDEEKYHDWPPVDLSELGEALAAKEECPGVYYISVRRPDTQPPFGTEYYLVLRDAPISPAGRRLGRPLKNGQGLVYPMDDEDGHSKVIEYELAKYRVANGLPIDEDLCQLATYGAELDPDYFGLLLAPAQTPWGRTLRYKTLDNGVYWLETDQLTEGLAVAFPIWGDLADGTVATAELMPEDCPGEDDDIGYRFYRKDRSSVAVFELLSVRTWWEETGLINPQALMNAMHEQCPEYVVTYNRLEQEGMHDILGLLLRALGVETELVGGEENMIRFTPGAGNEYIIW